MFTNTIPSNYSVNRNADERRTNCRPCSFNLSPIISLFLRRDVSKASARVTGGRAYQEAGYGLEIPCVYQIYGPKPYINKLRSGHRLDLQVAIVFSQTRAQGA